MNTMTAVFALNRRGLNVRRALEVVGVLLVPLLVLGVLDKEKYWLSLAFGILFVALSDPGGTYRVRVREMAWVAIVGTFLTGLGFAIGGGPWGWVVLAAFVVTFVAGLALEVRDAPLHVGDDAQLVVPRRDRGPCWCASRPSTFGMGATIARMAYRGRGVDRADVHPLDRARQTRAGHALLGDSGRHDDDGIDPSGRAVHVDQSARGNDRSCDRVRSALAERRLDAHCDAGRDQRHPRTIRARGRTAPHRRDHRSWS